MPIYAVQRTLTGITMDGLGDAQKAAIDKCNDFAKNGIKVNYIRSNFYPKDDSCTCLFEAEDPNIVKKVNEEASLPYDEIEEVLDLNP